MSIQYRIQCGLAEMQDEDHRSPCLIRLSPEAMGQLKREINPDLAGITEVVKVLETPVELDYTLPAGAIVLRYEVRV